MESLYIATGTPDAPDVLVVSTQCLPGLARLVLWRLGWAGLVTTVTDATMESSTASVSGLYMITKHTPDARLGLPAARPLLLAGSRRLRCPSC